MPHPPDSGTRNPARWLQTFTLTCLLLYLLPFALVRLPSFERWGGSPFGPAIDYPYTLRGLDADVVLFGDSSAAVGVNPRQLSAELGLPAVSLPNTAASLQVLGPLGLNRYLAGNRPPRLIVFYFAAWNLDYAHEPLGPRPYEGEEILLRRGTLAEIYGFVRLHPRDALDFPRRFYLANPVNALKSMLRRQHPAAEVAATQGYFDPMAGRPPLPEACTLPTELLRMVPDTTARALLARYRTPATRVLFVIAPMPACSQSNLLTSRRYEELGAEPIELLPASSFKQDFAYVHLRPAAVPANTTRLAALIRKALQ